MWCPEHRADRRRRGTRQAGKRARSRQPGRKRSRAPLAEFGARRLLRVRSPRCHEVKTRFAALGVRVWVSLGIQHYQPTKFALILHADPILHDSLQVHTWTTLEMRDPEIGDLTGAGNRGRTGD